MVGVAFKPHTKFFVLLTTDVPCNFFATDRRLGDLDDASGYLGIFRAVLTRVVGCFRLLSKAQVTVGPTCVTLGTIERSEQTSLTAP